MKKKEFWCAIDNKRKQYFAIRKPKKYGQIMSMMVMMNDLGYEFELKECGSKVLGPGGEAALYEDITPKVISRYAAEEIEYAKKLFQQCGGRH